MSTLHHINGKYTIYTKGALDVLLKRTISILTPNGIREITKEDKEKILKTNEEFSKNGLRVLAFVSKVIDEEKDITIDDEYNYTFIGLISMIDPPREASFGAALGAQGSSSSMDA